MARKDKRSSPSGISQPSASVSSPTSLSQKGRRFVVMGAALVVLGFVVLSAADSMGQNFAARLSPFVILCGYALIGVGLLFKVPS